MSGNTRSIFLLSIFALPLLFSACAGEEGGEEFNVDPEDKQNVEYDDDRMEKTEKIFYAIPSPMETAGLLKKAGAEYNKDILNDINNVDNYTSSAKMALNLGVYGTDLSYTSVFEQTQESILYTSCAKSLSDKLDITGAFTEETQARMEENIDNRDSLLSIISETYWIVDAYLKENDRENTSAMIIVGGWVEGLYIASQVASADPTDELKQRIAEQKLSLDDLTELVNTYAQDEQIDQIRADLSMISDAFTGVEAGTAGEGAITGEEEGIAVIGGGDPATITDEQLAKINTTVSTIRDSYIN